ncbi:MAG: NuoM family protein, partial [Myxococcales bacterium]
FGFIRYAMPLFPQAALDYAPAIAVLGVIGIVYGSFMCMAQSDLKRLIAYSSVAHLGFVMLGLSALTAEAASGAVLQMVNHGISTGALFLMIGYLYERTHTRDLAAYGGLARVAPAIAATFLVVTLSSIGLPGTNGFIGEFLVLLGTFTSRGLGAPWILPAMARPVVALLAGVLIGALLSGKWLVRGFIGLVVFAVLALFLPLEYPKGITLGVVGTSGVILGAVYMLWMYQRVFWGPQRKAASHGVRDLDVREWFTIAPLIAAIVWIGFFPQPLLSAVKEPVDAFVARVSKPEAPRPRAQGPAPSQDTTAPRIFLPQRAPMARPPSPEPEPERGK